METLFKRNLQKYDLKIDEIVSEISNYITLKIGDIIFTGSPAGVGSIKIEDFLEGFIEDKLIFEFRIK